MAIVKRNAQDLSRKGVSLYLVVDVLHNSLQRL